MRPLFLTSLLALFLASSSAKENSPNPELSRTPPEIYSQQLEKLLTKTEEVLAARTTFPAGDSSGVVLLAEQIQFRDDKGILYRLSHRVCLVATESAVKELGEDTFRFDRERESIFLVSAATIQSDGQRQAVDTKGAFIQTPQHDANNSLYTSEAELNVIFPNLTVGACTESIILIRENTPVIPGELSNLYIFGSGWPTYLRRLVLDLPDDDWKKMHLVNGSSGVPEPVAEQYASGRERRTWTKQRDARAPWEERSPSFEFCVPTLWFTTLESWDRVTHWFNQLIADRSTLGTEVEKAVDKATAGIADRRKIIDALTALVANEVRYTGLEFGLAGYQPYPCSDVWKNRYGDCKDKANLLRAMLAYKGIAAHVALLATESLGRVEKASPSWRQFNHAITAVENGDGTYLFCDPTIKYLPAGSLGVSDLAREILVVRGDTAEWVRTPDLLDAAIKISAELSLSPNGELSGWFNFDTEGSDAAYYARHFSELEHDDLQRDLQQYAEVFFPGATVMDTEAVQPPAVVKTYRARAYILRPSRAAKGETLKFPYPANWLPDLKTVGDRRRPYGASRREESVAITITLPPGWKVRSTPSPFNAPSDVARFAASWNVTDGKLKTQLSWRPERAELSPAEYGVFRQSVRALTSWLEQPAVLSAEGGTEAATETIPVKTEPLSGFPILPSGSGQLRLVDEKYPEGERNALRHRALEQILQWFPSDSDTVFTAKIQLAMLDCDEDHPKEFAETADALLARYGGQIPIGKRAWGEYLLARARWQAAKDPAAIKLMRKLAEDESLTPYRRGWSAHNAARYLGEKNPKTAITFLQPYLRFDEETDNEITGLMARLIAQSADSKALATLAAQIVKERRVNADKLLNKVISQISGQWPQLSSSARTELLAILGNVIANATDFPTAFATLKSLNTWLKSGEAQAVFVKDLSHWLAKHPPAWWKQPKKSRFKTPTEAMAEIDRLREAHDNAGAIEAVLDLLVNQQPDYGDFAKYLNRMMWWIGQGKSDAPLLEYLGERVQTLPVGDSEAILNAWDNYAEWLAKQKRTDEACTLYKKVRAHPDARDSQRVVAGGELGFILLRAGEIEPALAEFKRIEPIHSTNKWGADYLFTAILIHIDRGEYDRALDLIALVRDKDATLLDEFPRGAQMKHLIRAAADPEKLKRYWARQSRWQPVWSKILASHEVKAHSAVEIALMESFVGLDSAAETAAARSDTKAILSEMDTVAKLAAWIPLFLSDFNNMMVRTSNLSASLYHECCENTVAMCENFEPVDPQVDDTAQMWECAARIDLGQSAKAAPCSKALFEKRTIADSLGASGLRLWIVATRGTTEELQAMAILAKALDSSSPVADRKDNVRTLSDSYLLRKNHLANRQLLQRETSRPDFDSKSDLGRTLLSRLESSRGKGSSSDEFAGFIKNWIKQQDLDWLPEVPPATLDDPRFAGFTSAIEQSQPGISLAERIKFNLLFAQDDNQEPAARENAFCIVAFDVATFAADTERFCTTISEVCEQKSISPQNRARLLSVALWYVAAAGRLEATNKLSQLPIFAELDKGRQNTYTEVLAAMKIWQDGSADWERQAFTKFTDHPLSQLEVELAGKLLRHLALTGHGDVSDQFVAGLKEIKMASSEETTAAAVRLRWTRAIRDGKQQAPFFKIARDLLSALPGSSEPTPARVRYLLADYSRHQLSPLERLGFAFYSIRNDRVSPGHITDILYSISDAAHYKATLRALATPLVTAALKSSTPDSTKSELLAATASLYDFDQPAQRKQLVDLTKEFLASSESKTLPLTRRTAALWLAYVALRTSTEPRPAIIFSRLEEECVPEKQRTTLRLQYLFSRGEEVECEGIVDSLDPETLVEPNLYPLVKAVLLRANRTDEAKLLDETVRARLAKELPASWVPGAPAGTTRRLAESAVICNAGELLTDAWFKHVVRFWADPSDCAKLEISHAWLRKDWTALRLATEKMLQLEPEMYDYYYDRAMASYNLDDKAAAMKDLCVFLKYCRNSYHYPEALKLFQEFNSEAKKTTPTELTAALR